MTPEQSRGRERALARSHENAALCGFTHAEWMEMTRKERKERARTARKALQGPTLVVCAGCGTNCGGACGHPLTWREAEQ